MRNKSNLIRTFRLLTVILSLAFASCTKDVPYRPTSLKVELYGQASADTGEECKFQPQISQGAAYHYQWYINDTLQTDEGVLKYTFKRKGQYAVRLKVYNFERTDSAENVFRIDIGKRWLTKVVVSQRNQYWIGETGEYDLVFRVYKTDFANFQREYTTRIRRHISIATLPDTMEFVDLPLMEDKYSYYLDLINVPIGQTPYYISNYFLSGFKPGPSPLPYGNSANFKVELHYVVK